MRFDWLGRLRGCRRKCGGGWSRCCPGIGAVLREVGRGQTCGTLSMESFICCVRAASGRRCRRSLARPAQCIGTSRNGADAEYFIAFGKSACESYDARRGIGWRWQALDGAMTKAPLGGEKTGKNPTDRGKLGVKRSVVTDCRGVPLGIAVAGANTHDLKLLRATLQSIPAPSSQVVGTAQATSLSGQRLLRPAHGDSRKTLRLYSPRPA